MRPALFFCLLGILLFSSCIDDDSDALDGNEIEPITDITLTFIPSDGSASVLAQAEDLDGDQNFSAKAAIELTRSTDYQLAIRLTNQENPNDVLDLTDKVRSLGFAHQLFFAWSEGLFSNPDGNGNIDDREDRVNYNDTDANGFPVGLSTIWSTANTSSGELRILLKYQPGLKDGTATSSDGETLADIVWPINIL